MPDYKDLRSLSEKELAEALYRVSISMGADEKKARETARRAGEIRKILQRSSDRELDKIMSAIGKERADGIIQNVREKEKNS
jgi:transcription antitermination factor NusA-like protein